MSAAKPTISEIDSAYGEGFMRRLLWRAIPPNMEKFVETINFDLDKAATILSDHKNIIHSDDANEDAISLNLVIYFNGCGYQATHSANTGGNPDIRIDSKDKDFMWLGEAKIIDGQKYLQEGFLQLVTRYSDGSENRNHGALLVYIKAKANAKNEMEKWQKYLENSASENADYGDLVVTPCVTDALAFISTHTHSVSGLSYCVRHKPVLLYHHPQDKSGRASQSK